MNEKAAKALLPAGLADKLPPLAAQEADVIERLIACFAGHGYQRVAPPLVEFEDNLLSYAGADMAADTFRIMDPVSQRMMGLRADMTMQVARIAATRLRRAPRPLRLCYGGDVLRVRGSQLRPERQFAQVGAELIGPAPERADIRADVEMVMLAAEGLARLGIDRITVDLGAPSLVRSLLRAHAQANGDAGDLREALDHKDTAAVARLGGAVAGSLVALLEAAGPADEALERLARIDLPDAARLDATRLSAVTRMVREHLPDLMLTVDPVENRGFEYHTSFSLTVFARGVRGELGRGGRYVADRDSLGDEPGTGFTLFMDSVMRALAAPDPAPRVFLPAGTPVAVGRRLRAEGWVTVAGLEDGVEAAEEAARLGCTHLYAGDGPQPLGE